MKWLIASDIHGSAFYCKILLQRYQQERANRLILLGDILYHGPRNDLPKGYNPKKVIDMLNEIKNDVIGVRGNCDSQVDQMMLEFPMMSEYMLVPVKDHMIFVTHGHKFNVNNMPPLRENDILLFGHTHVPMCQKYDSNICLNPGSVSIPKEDSERGYMIYEYENDQFEWKNLDGLINRTYKDI